MIKRTLLLGSIITVLMILYPQQGWAMRVSDGGSSYGISKRTMPATSKKTKGFTSAAKKPPSSSHLTKKPGQSSPNYSSSNNSQNNVSSNNSSSNGHRNGSKKNRHKRSHRNKPKPSSGDKQPKSWHFMYTHPDPETPAEEYVAEHMLIFSDGTNPGGALTIIETVEVDGTTYYIAPLAWDYLSFVPSDLQESWTSAISGNGFPEELQGFLPVGKDEQQSTTLYTMSTQGEMVELGDLSLGQEGNYIYLDPADKVIFLFIDEGNTNEIDLSSYTVPVAEGDFSVASKGAANIYASGIESPLSFGEILPEHYEGLTDRGENFFIGPVEDFTRCGRPLWYFPPEEDQPQLIGITNGVVAELTLNERPDNAIGGSLYDAWQSIRMITYLGAGKVDGRAAATLFPNSSQALYTDLTSDSFHSNLQAAMDEFSVFLQ